MTASRVSGAEFSRVRAFARSLVQPPKTFSLLREDELLPCGARFYSPFQTMNEESMV